MEKQIRYYSFRFLNPVDKKEHRATAAIQRLETTEGQIVERVGVTVCNDSETFVRRIGQGYAQSRIQGKRSKYGFNVVSDLTTLNRHAESEFFGSISVENANFHDFLRVLAGHITKSGLNGISVHEDQHLASKSFLKEPQATFYDMSVEYPKRIQLL